MVIFFRDAQLAFMSLTGLVDVVITEDSDALVYGCRRVMFKLDKDGSGDEIKRRSLGANHGIRNHDICRICLINIVRSFFPQLD